MCISDIWQSRKSDLRQLFANHISHASKQVGIVFGHRDFQSSHVSFDFRIRKNDWQSITTRLAIHVRPYVDEYFLEAGRVRLLDARSHMHRL